MHGIQRWAQIDGRLALILPEWNKQFFTSAQVQFYFSPPRDPLIELSGDWRFSPFKTAFSVICIWKALQSSVSNFRLFQDDR